MNPGVFSYKLVVFIGRFQPIHYGHLETMKMSLKIGENLVIVLGSSKTARNIRCPWTPEERKIQILSCFTQKEKKRIHFIEVRDRLYNDIIWRQEITLKVEEIIKNNDRQINTVALIGHTKDDTSYYLKLFPQWETFETPIYENYHSTEFRKTYFKQQKINSSIVPSKIKKNLQKFQKTTHFKRLREEFLFIEKMNRENENKILYVANILLKCGPFLLLIKRRSHPGKGLYALPGGKIENNEEPLEAALRELHEETMLKIELTELKPNMIKHIVFHHPTRSLAGPSYAHTFYIEFFSDSLPRVKGSSDAIDAQWILCDQIPFMETDFFSDHYQISQVLLGTMKPTKDFTIMQITEN